jgi:hypothetical protein
MFSELYLKLSAMNSTLQDQQTDGTIEAKK